MVSKTLILSLPISRNFKLSLNFKIVLIFTIALILSLLAVCVYQLNRYTQEVYLIQNYESKIKQLSQENKILEINFSNTNSLKNITGFLQNQVFEKVGKVDYIYLLEGTALAK